MNVPQFCNFIWELQQVGEHCRGLLAVSAQDACCNEMRQGTNCGHPSISGPLNKIKQGPSRKQTNKQASKQASKLTKHFKAIGTDMVHIVEECNGWGMGKKSRWDDSFSSCPWNKAQKTKEEAKELFCDQGAIQYLEDDQENEKNMQQCHDPAAHRCDRHRHILVTKGKGGLGSGPEPFLPAILSGQR